MAPTAAGRLLRDSRGPPGAWKGLHPANYSPGGSKGPWVFHLHSPHGASPTAPAYRAPSDEGPYLTAVRWCWIASLEALDANGKPPTTTNTLYDIATLNTKVILFTGEMN